MCTAVERAREAGAMHLERTARNTFIARYEALVVEGLVQNPQPPPPAPGPRRQTSARRRKQSPVRNLLDRLWMREDEALWFREDYAIPFDNNQAERDLRMLKVQQKVSGTFWSEVGADAFCRIRSVCSTWRKQGRSALEGLERAFSDRSLSLHLPS